MISRELFEGWAKENRPLLLLDGRIGIMGGWIYENDKANDLWQAWQASRESMSDELFNVFKSQFKPDENQDSKKDSNPDWSWADIRDCECCGKESVATLHDSNGVPKCGDCYE